MLAGDCVVGLYVRHFFVQAGIFIFRQRRLGVMSRLVVGRTAYALLRDVASAFSSISIALPSSMHG